MKKWDKSFLLAAKKPAETLKELQELSVLLVFHTQDNSLCVLQMSEL